MIIDAHQHFWQYNPVTFSWIDESMAAIRQSFLPEDLKELLGKNNVDGTVLVQVNQTMEENDFFLSLADKNPFIKGVVGWVDLQADNLKEQLDSFGSHHKLKGFRHIVQAEQDPSFMQRPHFERGIAMLDSFNYTYDILIYPHQLASATKMVKRFPNQRFVIDHLAKPYIKKGLVEEWKKDMLQIAAYENVYCKISGMVTEADWKNWTIPDLRPYLDAAVEAFGVKRLIFGSDWPVCLLAADYTNVLSITQQYFEAFSVAEKECFFATNAIQFYNLNVFI